MAQPAEVFISYSREDAGRVLDLAGKLRTAGMSLWIDQSGIDAASLWSEQIVIVDKDQKLTVGLLNTTQSRRG